MKAIAYKNRIFWIGGTVPACQINYTTEIDNRGNVETKVTDDPGGAGWLQMPKLESILNIYESKEGMCIDTECGVLS